MSCDDLAPLISGLIDAELEPDEEARIRKHLERCERCDEELRALSEQRETTAALRLREPDPELWDRFHLGVYQRIERAAGWVLLSVGAAVAGGTLAYQAMSDVIGDPSVAMTVRVGLPIAAIGLVILLISVAREKLFLHRNERYREIIR
ncbi:MAG: hypothetical protein CME06_07280 [Gemmatimonadetes bacterium]|nr:hypothetical protein [Gemmatimonadota bacterium]